MDTIIETRDLTRSYWRTPVVNRLTLSVPRGSLCAFLGRNGAGKTTTLKMLAGLVTPTSGTSSLLGRDSTRLRPEEWRRIGYVSENQKLYDWMRVDEIIAFTRKLYPGWDEAFEKDLTRRFSLPQDRRIKHCSLGQRRKLALLLSLAYRPELLILDEPFGGLDALVKDEFLSGLLELTQQNEWTVFFSTHDIAEVERLADHVMVLEQGALELSEPLEALGRRFRKVEVYAPKPESFAVGDALDFNTSGEAFSYVQPQWRPEMEAELGAAFGPAVEVRPMPLREIFLSLARSYQKRES